MISLYDWCPRLWIDLLLLVCGWLVQSLQGTGVTTAHTAQHTIAAVLLSIAANTKAWLPPSYWANRHPCSDMVSLSVAPLHLACQAGKKQLNKDKSTRFSPIEPSQLACSTPVQPSRRLSPVGAAKNGPGTPSASFLGSVDRSKWRTRQVADWGAGGGMPAIMAFLGRHVCKDTSVGGFEGSRGPAVALGHPQDVEGRNTARPCSVAASVLVVWGSAAVGRLIGQLISPGAPWGLHWHPLHAAFALA